ncbi:MAG TPA: prolyl oligopeptidase family serine peptidase [Bryobacteraceae bacterium]|nr:prolyl oligopeptidase family serine peptidase [Bryobacteraceae bacterium]
MNYRLLFAGFLTVTLLAQKRPLTHNDYDAWRNIRSQHLSRDGKYLAYALFPQEGDGEFIVRNLATGKEWHESAGQTPPPPRPNYEEPTAEEGPPRERGLTIEFTHDTHFVVFSTYPPNADIEKAKRERKKPEDMPKNGMVVLDLSTGAAKRVDGVKNFQVPEDGADIVVYQLEPAKSEKTSAMIVRKLDSGADRQIDGVSEFSLSKDGKTVVYAADGLFSADPATDAAPQKLLAANGKFSKLTWDDKATHLAFVSDKGKLYLWDRKATAPADVTAEASGCQSGLVITDKAALAFSKDGHHVFYGCAVASKPPKKDDTPEDERVSFDLWTWKDDFVQPMQKVRANADRNRSYRGVYHIPEKRLEALGSIEMTDITPLEDGEWAIGGDDRAYRAMVEYDQRYRDLYLVNIADGSRHLISKKHAGQLSTAPDGSHIALYDGHDWHAISIPDHKDVNLTASLPVKFWNEQDDHPAEPPAYAPPVWTKDGKWLLLSDHFDIWQVAPDGSSAKNLTAGFGRKNHLMFRYARVDNDPRDRGVDASKPLLLRVEDSETYDTGFYRTSLGATTPPQKLLFGAKNYSTPIKAKDADVYVLAESTFTEFPDLQVTDGTFRELRKVSDANPQKDQFLWGTAELMHFKNADGVPLAGTLYKPENFDPHKKYPLIVYIYERLSQNVHSFVEPRPTHNINPTYYVSNGYLVLEPDIVYKIGYPGQSALDCVLPAIQAVVDQGYVDENAIGIQGHSWGGYQIAYMITRTKRFRAAAAGAPVANMTSAYDGIRWGPGLPRQFQYERSQSRIGGSLWEYPMRYIENSPLFSADRVTTPLLMIHNDADDAVPWYQGIEYYLALRRNGKEVYMFTYNGEPHGLRRRPNQKDYTVRLQEYFDHFLKGAPAPKWMEHGIPYIESHQAPARPQATDEP